MTNEEFKTLRQEYGSQVQKENMMRYAFVNLGTKNGETKIGVVYDADGHRFNPQLAASVIDSKCRGGGERFASLVIGGSIARFATKKEAMKHAYGNIVIQFALDGIELTELVSQDKI